MTGQEQEEQVGRKREDVVKGRNAERDRIVGHLVVWKPSVVEKSKKYTKVIIMKTQNNEGDRVPTSHLLGSYESPQAIKAIAKTTGCSSQTDSKDSLLKTTSTQLTKYDGEVNPVPA